MYASSFFIAGAYILSVEARNPLGALSVNISKPFYVQEAPNIVQYSNYKRLEMGDAVYETVLGNASEFIVSVDKGTDLKFDWDMGDGTQYTGQGIEPFHQVLNEW